MLNTYEGTIEGDVPASEKYEHSEMLLYRTSILEEEGQAAAALAGLEKEKGVRALSPRLLQRSPDEQGLARPSENGARTDNVQTVAS